MNEERARQGIEHLQAAGIEVIAALRAFLDVAETLVSDPAAAAAMANSLADFVRPDSVLSPSAPVAGEPRVTRIRVS